ncbi:MAG: DUF6602 domain-containing protein [Candidatus Hodarchaeales archaeon]
MLSTHLNYVEEYLQKIYDVQKSAGHPLHKGIPREFFIKEFIQSHLSELTGYGTGEIIDPNSKAGAMRNQVDIVIYKNNFPKINFGGGINGYFSESVISTIEVKSKLTKRKAFKAFDSISNVKALKRSFTGGSSFAYQPPGIFSFIVSYDGPKNLNTVYSWIEEYSNENTIEFSQMPEQFGSRMQLLSPLADLIIILGKGYIKFDNGPIKTIDDSFRKDNPDSKWIISNNKSGNLLLLFLTLTSLISSFSTKYVDLDQYITIKDRSETYFR